MKQILIVDDEESIRAVLKESLKGSADELVVDTQETSPNGNRIKMARSFCFIQSRNRDMSCCGATLSKLTAPCQAPISGSNRRATPPHGSLMTLARR